MANYLLHNLTDYEKTNFRELVLYVLKGRGCCSHLRDIPFGNMSLYDYRDWLRRLNWLEDDIKRAEEEIKEYTYKLNEGLIPYLDKEWAKLKSNIESYKVCKNTSYMDEAKKINKCKKNYKKYLDIFKAEGSDNMIYNALLKELEDIYETAKEDETYNLEKNKKSLESMKAQELPDYPMWKIEQIGFLQRHLRLAKEDLENAKENLKMAIEENEAIKEFFVILDKVDKKVKYE